MKIPIVSIVGRPNVGKSTLFNTVVGQRVAITAQEAGTTRDRLFRRISHPLLDFFLVDTGGLEFGKGETSIEDDMQTQSRISIQEADAILFVVDARTELTAADYQAAALLRESTHQKPVFLVVNKCDHPLGDAELAHWYALGLGSPFAVSALHKTGTESLMNALLEALKERHFLSKDQPAYKTLQKTEEGQIALALVGRPNVGKSSLINALLNKEKLIVSPVPGTTRDATDSVVRHQGKDYIFIDTAGLRRPGKTGTGIEHFSVLRSMAAIERSHVAVLVLDSSQPVSHQDQQIARFIVERGKAMVILANKWDLKKGEKSEKEEERRSAFVTNLQQRFSFLSWAPVLFTSAMTKKNLTALFEQAERVAAETQKRIATAPLNAFVQKLLNEHPPTGRGHKRAKFYYLTQAQIAPPHFVAFVNRKDAFHFSYWRYLENRLREQFGFLGTPIRVEVKEKTD